MTIRATKICNVLDQHLSILLLIFILPSQILPHALALPTCPSLLLSLNSPLPFPDLSVRPIIWIWTPLTFSILLGHLPYLKARDQALALCVWPSG